MATKTVASSKFKGMKEASATGGGGVYFLPGVYKVRVKKVHMLQSRKKDDLYIVEADILESNNSDRPPGSFASWLVNMKHDAALGNIKGFLAACNGIDAADQEKIDEEIDDDVADYSISEDNPLAGTEVELICTNIKTKAGGDFTLHTWSPA